MPYTAVKDELAEAELNVVEPLFECGQPTAKRQRSSDAVPSSASTALAASVVATSGACSSIDLTVALT
jgi:hypothetical protein